ncbi:ABC transporter ATP-binding protein [Enterococcus timonensis]|uniref:ABC transporter ATP-binding protein n=1 Tax=Enterococcus timonensis TaxID=1852364 RepID=UPI0008D95612|nr:ABC transporter ATP-binding protein [Enterococcus timonensis]
MKKLWPNYQKIIQLIWRIQKSVFVYGFFLDLTTILLPYLALWLSAIIVNGLVTGLSAQNLLTQTGIFLGAIFLVTLLHSWLTNRSEIVNEEFELKLQAEGTLKLLSIPYYQLQDAEIRENYQRAQDSMQYSGGFTSLLDNGMSALLQGVIALIIGIISLGQLQYFKTTDPTGLWSNSIWFVFLLLVVIFVPIILNIKIATKRVEIEKNSFEETVQINNQANYLLNLFINYENGPVLRLYQAGLTMVGRYKKFQKASENIFQKQAYAEGKLQSFTSILASILNAAVYLLVFLKAYYGAIGVGSVLLYAGYFLTMTGALTQLFTSLAGMNGKVEILAYYFDFLHLKPLETGTLPVEKRDDNQYQIEFHDVSFQYPGSDEWSLRHVDLKLKIGEKLAIVGRNGSGKSTLVKLLTRLYPVTEGKITLNGIEIEKYDVTEYQQLLAVVFQDFKLFAFSVAENVAASHTPNNERVNQALYIAGIQDKVATFPKGIETTLYKNIDEDGIDVSGGEAQKIAIARAWYRDAPFVVLDEPTSALDPFSEFEVYRRFDQLVADKTSIYISHRMSSTKFADKIVVFDHGEIIESGNHQELMNQAGMYANLFKAQAAYYTEKLDKEQVATLFA